MQKIFIVLLLLVPFVVGCQTMAVKRMQAKNPLAKNSPKTPTKMVDVWNTFAQTIPGGKPMRGIAGRIHFYNDSGKKQAVKVDGDLTVFLFDAKETDPAHAKPTKVFQFKAETLEKHYAHKKPLGHGYDFFLPIDELDGEEKTFCVMTRFDDRLEGSLVLTRPVNATLKGSTPMSVPENAMEQFLAEKNAKPLGAIDEKKNNNDEIRDDIRQVSYEKPAVEQKPNEKTEPQRTVATISLNDRLTRQLSSNPTVSKEEPSSTAKPIEQVSWTKEPAKDSGNESEVQEFRSAPKIGRPDYPQRPF